MTSMVLPKTNGSVPHTNSSWLQQTVQQCFGRFNWEDSPPEIQELKQTAFQGGDQPLSLSLKVSQFFNAINWEGSTIAAIPKPEEAPSNGSSPVDAFTLEDFSDLF